MFPRIRNQCSFDSLAETISPKVRRIFAESPKKFMELRIFSKKLIYNLKIFLWTSRMQF